MDDAPITHSFTYKTQTYESVDINLFEFCILIYSRIQYPSIWSESHFYYPMMNPLK